MKTVLIIVCIGLVLFLVYFFTQRNKGSIELGKVFSLESKSSVYYKNISFNFSTETVPFSKDPVTGIEKHPHDVYMVNVVWNGLISNRNPDGSEVKNLSTESNLYFNDIGGYQEFAINSIKYELNLVNYKDGKGDFILKEVGPGLKDKVISKKNPSFIFQIKGENFNSDIFVNDSFVNSVSLIEHPYAGNIGLLINRYLKVKQAKNTVKIGPIVTSNTKEVVMHVKIFDEFNPETVLFDKDIKVDSLKDSTLEIDFFIKDGLELDPQEKLEL